MEVVMGHRYVNFGIITLVHQIHRRSQGQSLGHRDRNLGLLDDGFSFWIL